MAQVAIMKSFALRSTSQSCVSGCHHSLEATARTVKHILSFDNMVDPSLAHPSRKVLLVVTTGSYSHARKFERNIPLASGTPSATQLQDELITMTYDQPRCSR